MANTNTFISHYFTKVINSMRIDHGDLSATHLFSNKWNKLFCII